jgi:hypothetical protein
MVPLTAAAGICRCLGHMPHVRVGGVLCGSELRGRDLLVGSDMKRSMEAVTFFAGMGESTLHPMATIRHMAGRSALREPHARGRGEFLHLPRCHPVRCRDCPALDRAEKTLRCRLEALGIVDFLHPIRFQPARQVFGAVLPELIEESGVPDFFKWCFRMAGTFFVCWSVGYLAL